MGSCQGKDENDNMDYEAEDEILKQEAAAQAQKEEEEKKKALKKKGHKIQYLEITNIRAQGLRIADFSGTSDPFIEIKLLDNKGKPLAEGTTSVIKKNLNPEFEGEVIQLWLHNPKQRFPNKELSIEVFDWNALSSPDFLGQDSLTLAASWKDPPIAPQEMKFYLQDRKSQKKKNLAKGKVFCHIALKEGTKKQREKYLAENDPKSKKKGSVKKNNKSSRKKPKK